MGSVACITNNSYIIVYCLHFGDANERNEKLSLTFKTIPISSARSGREGKKRNQQIPSRVVTFFYARLTIWSFSSSLTLLHFFGSFRRSRVSKKRLNTRRQKKFHITSQTLINDQSECYSMREVVMEMTNCLCFDLWVM